jgi:hypothetical protein
LRGGGRPSLRSVDSEIKRCVIEPRNTIVVSPRLGQPRGPSLALATPGPTGVPGHTGVGGTWRMIARVLRERGRPYRFHRNCGLESRLTNSRLIRGPCPRPTGTNKDETMVSPNEGNEVRRDGRQGVGVPHSSVEAGERALPDPVERRGCRVVDQTSDPRRGHRASSACHRKAMDRVRDSATT